MLLGDVVSFLVFAAIGRSSHGEAAGFAALFEVAKTAAPFLLGWLVVAPWTGVYRLSAEQKLAAWSQRTAITWLLAWPLALALRALFLQRAIPISFAIVTLITNAILLVGWRTLLGWWITRHTRR